MIVDQFDVVDVPAFKAEDDASVGLHGYGPIASQFAFERVESVVGNAHRLGRVGNIELSEHHFHAVLQIGTDEAAVAALIQALEPAMSEAPNDLRNVGCQ